MKNNPIVSENSTIDKETLASSQFSNLSRVKFVVGENVHCLYKVPFDHDLLDTMCPEGSMNQAYSQCFFYIFDSDFCAYFFFLIIPPEPTKLGPILAK